MLLLKYIPVNVADGATDDHSWQEETCWDVDTVGDGHQEVPGEEEDEHVCGIDNDTATHDVLDDFTFRTPENGCHRTILVVCAPSSMERLCIAQSQVSSTSFVNTGSCFVSFRAVWRTARDGGVVQEAVGSSPVVFRISEVLAGRDWWVVKTKIIASFF